ncbi:hypothetical protein ARMSODRAFT_1026957 [Armillaria solidipes]|uniref:BTB domain-containing protein n=1 Tax=Armillaria solidipes TaxID=1076256 RepID=A0A2H3BA62_9AGAR|nr:hypothetical protein ARMSODRAFT_1026957 [Armillaria solidipes]
MQQPKLPLPKTCAKDRFPDVVWEVGIDDQTEEVWGHKAIVYVQAPPSFQSRNFSFKPNNALLHLGHPLSHPSPPYSPTSLHFTLVFMYTVTLVFSHRRDDLDTAFHILRSAT